MSAAGRQVDFVTIACSDFAKFDLHTDASLKACAVLLENHKGGPKGAFQNLQQVLGLNYSKHGLLFNKTLAPMIQPITCLMHDFMHLWFVNGIFHVTFGLVMSALQGLVTYTALDTWMQRWSWPQRVAMRQADARSIFASKRAATHRKANKLSATASECLTIYSIVREFFLMVTLPICTDPYMGKVIQCYLDMCRVIDLLLLSGRGVVTPKALFVATVSFHRSFLECFDEADLIPKFHHTLHLWESLRVHGCLLSCFVHERKHRVVKRWANDDCNSSATHFERSILQEVVQDHVHSLSHGHALPPAEPSLVPPIRPAQKALSHAIGLQFPESHGLPITQARDAWSAPYSKCSVGDVVEFVLDGASEKSIGEIWYHVGIDGICLSVVSKWEAVDAGRRMYRICSAPTVVPTSSILETLMFFKEGDGHVAVMRPIGI